MSTRDVKALERHFFEEWNKGKAAAMAAIDETCANNVVWHGGGGEDVRGLRDFKKSMGEFFDAFPDNHFAVDDMFAEGDKVVARYTITGTHKGAYMGIQPTNKKVKLWVIEIDRVVGSEFVEGWSRFDTYGMMQQLGLAPTPEKK
jgi:predicted ester cyclase